MKTLGFAREHKLRLQRDFEDVFKNGKKTFVKDVVLWHKPVSRPDVKMGIVVSKKLGPAVTRNRVKRLIREVFRLNRQKINSGALLVISPRGSDRFKNFECAQDAVLELWRKAGVIADK